MTLNNFKKIIKERGGQSLGEVLVGLTIGSILIGAASFLIVNSLRSNASLEKSQKGTQIAQEMLDKVRSWGSADWFNVYSLSKGSDNKYFLNASGTTLSVISGEEGILSNDVTNGLVGHWRLDESTSTVAYDSSGSNNGGTLTNSPTRATSTCKISYCLTFDGVNDYLNILDNSVLDFSTNPFSVSLWIYVNNSLASSTEYGLINKNVTYQASAGWGLEISSWGVGGGKFNVTNYITTQTTWGNTNVSKGSLDVNTWYHVVGVRNSTTTYIYVDGVLGSSKSHADGAGNVDNAQPIVIGDNSWGPNFPGKIDDVRVYNRALSADEIKRLYQSSVYTRSFYVENVCRSTGATGEIISSGDSCAGGSANDPSTQKITVSVGWQTGVTTTQLMLNDYLTRWKNAIFEQTDWSGGVDNSGSYTNSSDSYSSTTNTDLNSGGVLLDLP